MEQNKSLYSRPELIEKIKEAIARSCATIEERLHVANFIMEIVNAPQSVIHISVNKILGFVSYTYFFVVFDERVNASLENRMQKLVDRIYDRIMYDFFPIGGLLIYLFCPEDYPLQMGEINQLNELSDEFPGSLLWGMASTPTSSTPMLRAIVLATTFPEKEDNDIEHIENSYERWKKSRKVQRRNRRKAI